MKPSAAPTVDESTLVTRCRRGDPEAWDELFERYYPAVGLFVFQYSPTFTHEDVEEICQEVFLAVIKNIASFRGKSTFRTWLFRIAINKARDFIEHRSATKRGGKEQHTSLDQSDQLCTHGTEIANPASGPDQSLIAHEEMLLLHRAISELPDPCREIIELRYFGDLSYHELAAILNLNPKTVSSRLSKCLDRLKRIVERLFSKENMQPFSV